MTNVQNGTFSFFLGTLPHQPGLRACVLNATVFKSVQIFILTIRAGNMCSEKSECQPNCQSNNACLISLFGSQPHIPHPHNAAHHHHHHIFHDNDHHRIFSEWSSLDLAWTSAFSLIVVTSVVGNVMVGSIKTIQYHIILLSFLPFLSLWLSLFSFLLLWLSLLSLLSL